MTDTLIATNTLDACIHICPPPPSIHTALQKHMHNTTHNIQCQGWGRVGKRPNTSTAQTPPQCRAISHPPPFHVMVWVVGPLLVMLKVREGIHFLFASGLFFFIGVKKWVHSDTKR